jgi:phytanoyl-CoA hydroxylase
MHNNFVKLVFFMCSGVVAKMEAKWCEDLASQGFLVLTDILDDTELSLYRGLYQDFMSGKLDASSHRHDLGSHVQRKTKAVENITQIMWPSLYMSDATRPIPSREQSPIHAKAQRIARYLLGDDMVFDFDMLISKV